jgi:hypothetical protein
MECKGTVRDREFLECGNCTGVYHWQCFRVRGHPTRLGDGALGARRGDCRRRDFVCEACNFREQVGRDPVGDKDRRLLELDRMVTVDQFHKDAESSSSTCLAAVRQVDKWGESNGLGNLLARSGAELRGMSPDHRRLAWFFADKARTVKFETVKRLRGAVFNYYERMTGVTEIPTATLQFRHRFDGLAQRLGVEVTQAQVFRGILLRDVVKLLESDWARARGDRKRALVLVNAAFHLYCQAGLRANEAFHCTLRQVSEAMVVGARADRLEVQPHFHWACATQTKEERYAQTAVPVAYGTHPPCPLEAGRWIIAGLQSWKDAAGGTLWQPDRVFFSDDEGEPWSMNRFWAREVAPRLEQLRGEKLGGLREGDDLSAYGSNSFRRTWDSMAAKAPNRVPEDLRERQGRWRNGQRARQRLAKSMVRLYNEPDLQELLRATFFLTPLT